MKTAKSLTQYFAAYAILALTGCTQNNDPLQELSTISIGADIDSRSILPLPAPPVDTDGSIALGMRLFHDPRLSADQTISCANCHQLDRGGEDGLVVSPGVDGKLGKLNAPTVLNSGLNLSQFWDGRAATLEEQIDGPIHAEVEMASNWPLIISRLQQDPSYVETFSQIYKSPITEGAIKNAIANFERSLITPDSPFDLYLKGDKSALNDTQRLGYQRFQELGCISCHQGINIGGNMYQRIGVIGDYFADRGNVTESDFGRYNVTGHEEDRYRFKVPSLRNVALTAPYFHDGKTATLEEAIRKMAYYQLGEELSEGDITHISAFLHSLTAKIDLNARLNKSQPKQTPQHRSEF